MVQDQLFESLLVQLEWYKTSRSSHHSSSGNGTRPAVRAIALPVGMAQDQLLESFLFEHAAIQSLLHEIFVFEYVAIQSLLYEICSGGLSNSHGSTLHPSENTHPKLPNLARVTNSCSNNLCPSNITLEPIGGIALVSKLCSRDGTNNLMLRPGARHRNAPPHA